MKGGIMCLVVSLDNVKIKFLDTMKFMAASLEKCCKTF